MTMQDLEGKLRDASISDEEFFDILAKYFEERIGTPMEQEDAIAFVSLGKLIMKLRPAVFEIMRHHLARQHERYCRQKNKE